MSYYPILSAPYCTGQTTLYNFPPNNWESIDKVKQFINLTYIEDSLWRSVVLGELDYKYYKTINYSDIDSFIPQNTLPLLSLTKTPLAKTSTELPTLNCNHTNVPAYRSTLRLKSEHTTTSYQGEINPFPPKASLLSFSPFLQFGNEIENYVLLLNIEKSPSPKISQLEIYNANDKTLKKTQEVHNNQLNIVSLDGLGFSETDLPVIMCKTMAVIPLYFSCTHQGEYLSLEHSHPPASFVVHGNRFGVQKFLKDYWFSELKNDE